MAWQVRWHRNLSEIPQGEWDALAESVAAPILEWEWLYRLETSGSVCPETGWVPLHLTVREGRDLVAAAPFYVKFHSGGEFVWDHTWAEVAEHLGIAYHPKLVGMSPATPIPGYRFLIAPGQDEDRLTTRILDAATALCDANGLSGTHFPYADPVWGRSLADHGFLPWEHQSFRWENPGHSAFQDYLAGFRRGQRRNILRERAAIRDAGIQITALAGDRIRAADLDHMAAFYLATNARYGPWAARYLSPEFFAQLHPGYRHRLLLLSARRHGVGDPLAMAFLLRKGDGLYGRYWGTREQIPALHFELCYYAPIEWAIEHGIRHFDPGIGGEHKLRRGFRAVPNHSLHRFRDPRLQAVMAAHIERINAAQREQIDALNRSLPLHPRGGL